MCVDECYSCLTQVYLQHMEAFLDTMFGTNGGTNGGAPVGMEVRWVPPDDMQHAWPCVDCGLLTGNFCDGGPAVGYDQCFAAERVPQDFTDHKDELGCRQPTPLCSYCETRYHHCRFCRGVKGCTPPTRNSHWSGVPNDESREFDERRANLAVLNEFASRRRAAEARAAEEDRQDEEDRRLQEHLERSDYVHRGPNLNCVESSTTLFGNVVKTRKTNQEKMLLGMIHDGAVAVSDEDFTLTNDAKTQLNAMYGTYDRVEIINCAGWVASSRSNTAKRGPPGLTLEDRGRPSAKTSAKRRSNRDQGEAASSSTMIMTSMPPPPMLWGRNTWYDFDGNKWTSLGRTCTICHSRKLKQGKYDREETFPFSNSCWYCGGPGDHHGWCCFDNSSPNSRNGMLNKRWWSKK